MFTLTGVPLLPPLHDGLIVSLDCVEAVEVLDRQLSEPWRPSLCSLRVAEVMVLEGSRWPALVWTKPIRLLGGGAYRSGRFKASGFRVVTAGPDCAMPRGECLRAMVMGCAAANANAILRRVQVGRDGDHG